MHFYSSEWKRSEKFHAKLRQKANTLSANSNIQWVLEKFPESKLVPEKKE